MYTRRNVYNYERTNTYMFKLDTSFHEFFYSPFSIIKRENVSASLATYTFEYQLEYKKGTFSHLIEQYNRDNRNNCTSICVALTVVIACFSGIEASSRFKV